MKRQESKVQLTQEEVQWLVRVRAACIAIYLGIFAAVLLAPEGDSQGVSRTMMSASR